MVPVNCDKGTWNTVLLLLQPVNLTSHDVNEKYAKKVFTRQTKYFHFTFIHYVVQNHSLLTLGNATTLLDKCKKT